MFAVKKAESPSSFNSSVQNLDRKMHLDALVTDIGVKIEPNRVLVHPATFLSRSGPELINLKVGEPLAAMAVRDILLRLELLRTISGETFVALQGCFQAGVPLSDWHAVNAATYSLGETKNSRDFSRALKSEQSRAFWRGFSSVFTFGAIVGDWDSPKVARLQFEAKPGVRDVFLSALNADGTLGNPERT